MKTRTSRLLALMAGAAVICGGWAAVRAHRDRVTLNVRDMEIREVVKKIEWQTWDTIVVHTNVQGKVTLNVSNRPVSEVLNILGEQTASRSGVIYPLYSSRKSFASFKQALSGERSGTAGWTNLLTTASIRPGLGMGRDAGNLAGSGLNSNQLVSLQIGGKAVATAAQAFSRFAQARVVPEDGVSDRVYLTLKNVTTSEAVARLARSIHRSWTKVYTLRKEFGPGAPGRGNTPQMAAGDTNSENRRAAGPRRGGQPESAEARAQRDAREDELLAMLPASEREKAETERAEREKERLAMEKLTPEQRHQAGGPMGGRDMSFRMLDRIKNTTPEQRVEQRRQMALFRAARSAGQLARR